jgi:hypothetical protein
MRDGTDPVQDVVDRLAQMTREAANARGAKRMELPIPSTRTGPAACHIQSSHPGR